MLSLSLTTITQTEENKYSNIERTNFGLGIGNEYGSLGINFCGYITRSFGAFVGVGYDGIGVGNGEIFGVSGIGNYYRSSGNNI